MYKLFIYVLFISLLITLSLCVFLDVRFGLAWLAGAVNIIVPNFIFSLIFFKGFHNTPAHHQEEDPAVITLRAKKITRTLYWGVAVKWLSTLLLFAILLQGGWLSMFPLLLGFITTQILYMLIPFLPFIKNDLATKDVR